MPSIVESLKKQFGHSTEKIENWNAKETANYIKAHSTTKEKTTTKAWEHLIDLEKRKKCPQKILSNLFNDNQVINRIASDIDLTKKLLKTDTIRKEILDHHNLLLQNIFNKNLKLVKENPKFRKLLLSESGIPCEALFNACPKTALDPRRLPIRNTGVYLWANGYDIITFLGHGGFGVVWECIGKDRKTHKAVKVIRNDRNGIEEIKNAKKLYEMFKDDEKAQKYLNLLKPKKNTRAPILKALLAQQDLFNAVEEKSFGSKNGKTIDSLLRNSEQALKAVKTLHEAGYSHNDIKPQNFLKIDNWKSKQSKLHTKEVLQNKKQELNRIKKIKDINTKLKKTYDFLAKNKIQNSKIENIRNSKTSDDQKVQLILDIMDRIIANKIHRNRIQLADFGTVTPIPDGQIGLYQRISTPGYVSRSDRAYLTKGYAPKGTIEKRDTYALGVTLMYLLAGRYYREKSTEWIYFIHKDINDIDDLLEGLRITYSGETNNERLIEFLTIIRDMTYDNYSERIDLSTALSRIHALRGKK